MGTKKKQSKQKAKKWVAWFTPQGRGQKFGPLYVTLVEISELKKRFPKVIISVPKATGNAVRRNKFRRIIREGLLSFFKKEEEKQLSSREAIWIRLDARFALGPHMSQQDWAPHLRQIEQKL